MSEKIKFSGTLDKEVFQKIQRMSEGEGRSFNSMLGIVVDRGLLVDGPINSKVGNVRGATDSEGAEVL